MRQYAIILCWVFIVQSAFSATVTCPSGALVDVSNTVASATAGDTVRIPSGSNFWLAGLEVTNSLEIIGAGTNATVIAASNNATTLYLNPSGTLPVRVSGIHFTQFTNAANSHNVMIEGTNAQFRVDHCLLENGLRSLYVKSGAFGVADHNTFLNGDIAVGITGNDDAAWDYGQTPGTTNAFFIEDNLFLANDDRLSGLDESIYHQQGGRTVTRNNVFDYSGLNTNAAFFDSHGNWGAGVTDPDDEEAAKAYRGQPIVEVYSNAITAHRSYGMIGMRGGCCLIYSNVFTQTLPWGTIIRLDEEEAWSTSFWDPLRTNYPAWDQITNTFIWANTANKTNAPVEPRAEAAFLIELGRDYWTNAPCATNGSPAGVFADYAQAPYPHPLIRYFEGSKLRTTTLRAGNVTGP